MVSDIRKILVLRFSSLGDIVMLTPTLRALRARFPFAQIDLVVRADFLDLVRDNPHVDRKIGLPRGEGVAALLRLGREINRERYDLVYDAHRSLRTMALMPFIRTGAKAYFRKNYVRRDLALTLKLPLLSDRRTLERYIEPLSPWGVSYDGRGPEIFFTPQEKEAALAKLAVPRLPEGAFRIGLIPSAQWPGKRWPEDRFRRVAQRIVEESQHQILVFGGREDTFCQVICADLPSSRVVNLQGKLSIVEAAVFLAQCHFVIANDTGLMHMADALGLPSVLILGPTSKELGCLPFHPWSVVLEHDLWCRPCSKNGQAPCVRRERYCLSNTTADSVFEAAAGLWRRLSRATA